MINHAGLFVIKMPILSRPYYSQYFVVFSSQAQQCNIVQLFLQIFRACKVNNLQKTPCFISEGSISIFQASQIRLS